MITYDWNILSEGEWLSSIYPGRFLHFVQPGGSERKIWLFACACCRRLPGYLESDGDRLILEAAERHVEGIDSLQEMLDHNEEWGDIRFHRLHPFEAASRTIESIWFRHGNDERAWAEYAGIFRDIFGNPFRPVAFDPAWVTPTVEAIARGIYHERELPAGRLDNARLRVLSDALEEAGCGHEDILSHCRRPAYHVRGCWVVDMILNKDEEKGAYWIWDLPDDWPSSPSPDCGGGPG
jgi:hypothetical protein